MPGQRREAADFLQYAAAYGDGRAERERSRPHPRGDAHRRQEPVVDETRADHRPQSRLRFGAVGASDDADIVILQRSDDGAQILRRHAYVAVGDHQVIVAHGAHHIDQIADLAVAAVQPAVDDAAQIRGRKLAPQAVDDRDRGIGLGVHAEEDLIARIGLNAKRAQALVGRRLDAAQRLQDRHRRPFARRARPRRRAPAHGEASGDQITGGEHCSQSAEADLPCVQSGAQCGRLRKCVHAGPARIIEDSKGSNRPMSEVAAPRCRQTASIAL